MEWVWLGLGMAVCFVVAIIPALRMLLAQRARPYEDAKLDAAHEPWLLAGPDGPAWWPEFEREFAAHVAERGADGPTA
jgi:hypothetical protein